MEVASEAAGMGAGTDFVAGLTVNPVVAGVRLDGWGWAGSASMVRRVTMAAGAGCPVRLTRS